MNALLRIACTAVTVLALAAPATAQNRDRNKPRPVAKTETVEARARDVVLPNDTLGTLVMKACLQCSLKSYTVSASTKYYLYEQPATLSEVRAAVAAAGNPEGYIGVTYSARRGEVTAVTAHARRVAAP